MTPIGSVEITATGEAGDLKVKLGGSTCGGCCWKTGEGNSTAGPGRGLLHVVATGVGCDTGRSCVGSVTGKASSLQIEWACTCHKPAVFCGAMGAGAWTKA